MVLIDSTTLYLLRAHPRVLMALGTHATAWHLCTMAVAAALVARAGSQEECSCACLGPVAAGRETRQPWNGERQNSTICQTMNPTAGESFKCLRCLNRTALLFLCAKLAKLNQVTLAAVCKHSSCVCVCVSLG